MWTLKFDWRSTGGAYDFIKLINYIKVMPYIIFVCHFEPFYHLNNNVIIWGIMLYLSITNVAYDLNLQYVIVKGSVELLKVYSHLWL